MACRFAAVIAMFRLGAGQPVRVGHPAVVATTRYSTPEAKGPAPEAGRADRDVEVGERVSRVGVVWA